VTTTFNAALPEVIVTVSNGKLADGTPAFYFSYSIADLTYTFPPSSPSDLLYTMGVVFTMGNTAVTAGDK